MATRIDPWQAQSRREWRNRWQDWRAAPAEPLLHAGAVLLVAALLLPPAIAIVRGQATMLRDGLDAHLPASAALLFAGSLALLVQARRRDRARLAGHWLALQPLPPALARRHLRRRSLLHAGAQVAVLSMGAGLLALAAQDWALLALPAAALLLLLLVERSAGERRAPTRRDVVLVSDAVGRLWRWQWLEIASLLAPKRAGWLLFALLLVPSATGPWLPVYALGCLLLAAAGAAWQRSLAVLPAARAWLAAQPVPPARLLRRWALLPLSALALAAALLGWLLALFGLPPAAGALASGAVIALGLLQIGCVAASASMTAAGLAFLLQFALLLLAVLQALPPLALLLWPLQLGLLLRRGLRR